MSSVLSSGFEIAETTSTVGDFIVIIVIIVIASSEPLCWMGHETIWLGRRSWLRTRDTAQA